jgi:hypothetical protein
MQATASASMLHGVPVCTDHARHAEETKSRIGMTDNAQLGGREARESDRYYAMQART